MSETSIKRHESIKEIQIQEKTEKQMNGNYKEEL